MQKAKQSERLKGNQNARKGPGSQIVRLPSAIIKGLHQCLETEDFPGEIDQKDIYDYVLSMVRAHIEKVTGEYIPLPYEHDEDTK